MQSPEQKRTIPCITFICTLCNFTWKMQQQIGLLCCVWFPPPTPINNQQGGSTLLRAIPSTKLLWFSPTRVCGCGRERESAFSFVLFPFFPVPLVNCTHCKCGTTAPLFPSLVVMAGSLTTLDNPMKCPHDRGSEAILHSGCRCGCDALQVESVGNDVFKWLNFPVKSLMKMGGEKKNANEYCK